MRCFVGIDDTDSAKGFCTTYLAFRIASDLRRDLTVLPYPRLVRLNPNIPFKTRGNAAVCLHIETRNPVLAFERLTSKLSELSDVGGGANSGLVFLKDNKRLTDFRPLYQDAISGVVAVARVRRFLADKGIGFSTLGNGMGLVGASAALGFNLAEDHTFELISYRMPSFWGRPRVIDTASVREMDVETFPHTFNNYDYKKRKVLISPHGPDPVFAGVRGDSPSAVLGAFEMLRFSEPLAGHMLYVSNQHTDAHLRRRLDWKTFSAGWAQGVVKDVTTGQGGHVYAKVIERGVERNCAFYEPTGDLRLVARRLVRGDRVRLSGGVRRATSAHQKVLNVERLEVLSLAKRRGDIIPGTYISSPRANRHLTMPLTRYGSPNTSEPTAVEGWLGVRLLPVPARSR